MNVRQAAGMPHRTALVLGILLCAAGCGDSMSRGLIITGDGKVGANNARNQRDMAQEALRTAIADDLGPGWDVRVVIDEQPEWVEERAVSDGAWRWARITAAIVIVPPPGAALPEAKRSEYETDARAYLVGKLKRRDPSLLSLAITTGAAVASPGTSVPASPGGPRTYTVQAGDTLADLSTAFYGSPQHWRLIAEANPGSADGPLAPGSRLAIPPLPPAR